jgi:hypothetical protein
MIRFASSLVVCFALALIHGDQPPAKQQLAKLQSLVGSWRGVAQPIRGSAKDSWIEKADWAWDFSQAAPALIATLPQGKHFRRLRLTAGDNDEFTVVGTVASNDAELTYTGKLDGQQQLVLIGQAPDGLPRRLTFRFVASGDRLLLLMEKRGATADTFQRLAEIGYTRSGSGFGNAAAQRECIVTGGLGNIEVSHQGKTYYVCCTGCRDYFNANPEQVLADYAAKKKPK